MSAQKFAVWVCQVATVMETMQLVLSQLKKLFIILRIEYGLFLPKMISKCCELVKLCHINCRSPVFLRQYIILPSVHNGMHTPTDSYK